MGRLLDENDVYALFAPNGTARLHVADIDALPRVEYRAPRAKWIPYYEYGWRDGHRWLVGWNCSACEKFSKKATLFCSECGAEMRMED